MYCPGHQKGTAKRQFRALMLAEDGFSPAEMMATIGITVLVLSLSVLGLNSKFIGLGMTAQSVANDVRLARVAAVTRGAHYRVIIGANWYRTERLQDNDHDRIWMLDTSVPANSEELPGGVTMTATTGNQTGSGTGVASIIEFDGRGMVVPPQGGTLPSIMTISIRGSADPNAMRGTLNVFVWPSGQVELLRNGEAHL
jgi:hypothetical protein